MRRPLLLVLAVALMSAGAAMLISFAFQDPRGGVIMDVETFSVAEPEPDPTRSAQVAAVPQDTPSPTTTAAAEPAAPSTTPDPPQITMDPASMEPSRLYVPSLGIYTSLEPVTFRGSSLTIPSEPWQVGIDTGSAQLSSPVGTTLLAGHLDLRGTPGSLAHLGRAQPGAMVYVTDAQGRRFDFIATSLHQYYKTWLPREIFDVEGARQVAIVTCGGPIEEIDGVRHYRDNVVLTAVPA